jgi:hypothetical protein
MENDVMQWLTDYNELQRNLQECIWMIEDVAKMSKEELAWSIKKNEQKILEDKDKIEYDWRGKKLLFRQPYWNE